MARPRASVCWLISAQCSARSGVCLSYFAIARCGHQRLVASVAQLDGSADDGLRQRLARLIATDVVCEGLQNRDRTLRLSSWHSARVNVHELTGIGLSRRMAAAVAEDEQWRIAAYDTVANPRAATKLADLNELVHRPRPLRRAGGSDPATCASPKTPTREIPSGLQTPDDAALCAGEHNLPLNHFWSPLESSWPSESGLGVQRPTLADADRRRRRAGNRPFVFGSCFEGFSPGFFAPSTCLIVGTDIQRFG